MFDVRARRQPADFDRPPRRPDEPEQQADEGALARPVRPRDAEHFARSDVERNILDREDVAHDQ